jgi:hypothetical protein
VEELSLDTSESAHSEDRVHGTDVEWSYSKQAGKSRIYPTFSVRNTQQDYQLSVVIETVLWFNQRQKCEIIPKLTDPLEDNS